MDSISVRVDYAGGWLDVPGTGATNGFIVNCAVTPGVSRGEWPYHIGGGLGGSAAHDILDGRDPFVHENLRGVGWQDPAILLETGFCVWRAGDRPHLLKRTDAEMVRGRMALQWTYERTKTAGQIAELHRPYQKIIFASRIAAHANKLDTLAVAMRLSHDAQVIEGMTRLRIPRTALATKYCGAGWGGYSLHLFNTEADRDAWVAETQDASSIEPWARYTPQTTIPLLHAGVLPAGATREGGNP